MSVTEYALIKLRDDPNDNADFANISKECFDIQQAWVRQHQPHLLAKDNTQFSTLCAEQDTSDHCVLITAPWDSPEGHGKWIHAEENQTGMKALATHVAEKPNAVMVLHLEPYGTVLPRRFAEGKQFKTYEVPVDVAKKDEVKAEFGGVDEEIRKTASNDQYWAGWSVETVDNQARLIIFLDPTIQPNSLTQFLDKHPAVATRTFKNIL